MAGRRILMTDNETVETDQDDSEMVYRGCKACGAKMFGVDETEAKRMVASHILNEHAEEAPETVLEEARERINHTDSEGKADR